jgi:predicted HNH restriction endonuclease
MWNLEVHHKAFRSLSGEDTEQNLITLCKACHRGVHESGISGAINLRISDGIELRQWLIKRAIERASS